MDKGISTIDNKIIYTVTLTAIFALSAIIILRILYPIDSLFLYFDYFILGLIIFDLIVLNRTSSSRGLKHEKTVFYIIIGVFILNLIWQIQATIEMTNIPEYKESIFLPYRIITLILILGLFVLALNKGSLGVKLKSLSSRLKEPTTYIFFALLFLIICPFFLFFKQEVIAEKAANIAYFLLLIGVLGQFIKYIIKGNKKNA